MSEITNEDVLKSTRENFTKVFEETFKIRVQNANLIDKMDPTFNNVRILGGMIEELTDEVKRLQAQISSLRSEVRELKA
ncbi:hypothetical protein [Adhaeribacter soli]|uniref:Uncharacterized protein n=1 Tax=Adhaeribacter soli TaxID=2607655 RepID=A0A5N1II28_9BACT|nr:hypothetical protein [Adhaeribacter soli]KAA9325048.1 hypothetical protein F0P94_19275 [Adhaeribacter soli]